MTVLERLMRRVAVDEASDCWLWTGSLAGDGGYGQIRVDGRLQYVHRVSYELHVGPIPDGHQVDHVRARGCLHRNCVNPDHLEPVKARENVARSSGPAAITVRTGVCPRGHEQTADAVYVNPRTGERQCRPCKSARTVESAERKRSLTHV